MLLEGSPSKSANHMAAVELELKSAAIKQSTPAIVYSPLTVSLGPFVILTASAANFTV